MSNFSIFLAFEGDTKKFSLQLSRPKAWTFEASAFGSTAKAIKLTWRCLEGKAWPWGLRHCLMHLLNLLPWTEHTMCVVVSVVAEHPRTKPTSEVCMAGDLAGFRCDRSLSEWQETSSEQRQDDFVLTAAQLYVEQQRHLLQLAKIWTWGQLQLFYRVT